jgi:Fe-S cluster assembly ATPase SufC
VQDLNKIKTSLWIEMHWPTVLLDTSQVINLRPLSNKQLGLTLRFSGVPTEIIGAKCFPFLNIKQNKETYPIRTLINAQGLILSFSKG